MVCHNTVFWNNFCIKSYVPRQPEGTRVIVISIYIYEHNLYIYLCDIYQTLPGFELATCSVTIAPIPSGHSGGQQLTVPIDIFLFVGEGVNNPLVPLSSLKFSENSQNYIADPPLVLLSAYRMWSTFLWNNLLVVLSSKEASPSRKVPPSPCSSQPSTEIRGTSRIRKNSIRIDGCRKTRLEGIRTASFRSQLECGIASVGGAMFIFDVDLHFSSWLFPC